MILLYCVWAILPLLASSNTTPDAKSSTTVIPVETSSESATPTAPPTEFAIELSEDPDSIVKEFLLPFGSQNTLSCKAKLSNGDKPLVTWHKDGKLLTETSTLVQLDGSSVENAGLYKCSHGKRSEASAKVFVVEETSGAGDEGEEEEEEEEDIEYVEVTEGEEVELAATLTVFPAALVDYSLVFIGVLEVAQVKVATYTEVEKRDRIVVSDVSNSLRYVIDSATPRDHGLYKLVVRYGDQEDVIMFFLTVTYAPVFFSLLKAPQFVSVDEDIALTVEVGGYPKPNITWYHQTCCPQVTSPTNINELTENDPEQFRFYHLLNDETMLNLIGGVKKFNGSYWVEAQNKMGSVSSDRIDYRLRGYGIRVDAGAATNVSHQVEYENIGSLKLTCVINRNALSKPEELPLITWYHENRQINNTTQLERGADEILEIMKVNQPTLADAGEYSCIARTQEQTLWSFGVAVTVVKQPIISVSPQVYQTTVGSTVIFSCLVDNIDGVQGEDWDTQYKVKQPNQKFTDISKVHEGGVERGLLYLRDTESEVDVRCETTPGLHSAPIYNDGKVDLVENAPVTVNIHINRRRYTEGEAFVIRCTVRSLLDNTGNTRIYWQHGDNVVSSSGGGGGKTLSDGTRVELYSSKQSENTTTEVLFIEEMGKGNAGEYTCVYDAGENGRFEDISQITVHPPTPLTAISLIIAVCFVFILVILMGVVLACVITKSRQHSYSVAEKHDVPSDQ